MRNSARIIGAIMLAAGVIIGFLIVFWLNAGLAEGNLQSSGAVLGGILGFGAIVAPLVGFGIFFLFKGASEAREYAAVDAQRELLDIVQTQGQISIPDLVLQLHSSRDAVEKNLYALVGRGIFSGYVDWKKGVLYSIDASKLEGRQTCPNCGGKLEIAGKGMIKCPYCGAEIFL